MKRERILALAVIVVSPVFLASVVVFPQIAWILLALAASLATLLLPAVFDTILFTLLAAGILGAIGESGQLGNLLSF